MILSVSRRTDIPACYADWFFNRLREGFVLVRNPVTPRSVARVSLIPEVVDGIVFWTKNPRPMLDRLSLLQAYPYCFQITITAYGEDLEPQVPSKWDAVIPAFRQLSEAIGPDRVIWRFDPILLNDRYTPERQLDAFARMARALEGHTRRCVFGFVEDYKNTHRHRSELALLPIGPEERHAIVAELSRIAQNHGMALLACCEAEDFSRHGVQRAACIDATLLQRIAGVPLKLEKDRNQRKACRCAASVDIGAYNTCENGCLYCYANYDEKRIPRNRALHDARQGLLVGAVGEQDTVYDRAVRSCREEQTRLL